MQHIVVATDFSTRSDRAVRRAGLLAQEQRARLTLLHVVDDDRPERLVSEEAITARQMLAETAGSVLRDVQCEVEVARGDPFAGIAKTAEERAADLIVMGAHRKQILKDIFIGTSVERVMRMRIAPVLMVNAAPVAAYGRGLVATDLSEQSGIALQTALALGILPRTVVAVHAFGVIGRSKLNFAGVSADNIAAHAAQSAAVARTELADFLAAFDDDPPRYALKVAEGRAADVIADVAVEINVDVVVIGTHGRTGIGKLLLGSVSEEVTWRLDRDILVVPPRSKHA
jgi:universal stress protein E